MNLWAEDLPAATRWYTALLGVEPYFTSEAAGRGPGYVEFRVGDYQHELGIIDRRFAPPALAAEPGGVVVYWHVDDVAATLDRLVSLGAKQLEAGPRGGPGVRPAPVAGPVGNGPGVMYHPPHLRNLFQHPTTLADATRSQARSTTRPG